MRSWDVRWQKRASFGVVLCLWLSISLTAFAIGGPRGAMPLTPGKTVDMLSYIDARLPGSERYRRYKISANAGETWEIEAVSPHFSPYLMLRGARLQRDAGGELGVQHARLRFVVREDADVELIVSTAAPGEMGVFELRVTKERSGEARTERPMPTISELVPGSRVDGQIARDGERTSSGILVQRYVYHGEAGERISLRTSSRGFVPLLMIHGPKLALHSGAPVGRQREVELQATLPETGRYVVRVLAGPGVQAGEYTLRLRQHAIDGADMQRTRRLVLGANVEGALQPGDQRLEDGQWADRYKLRLESGQRASLHLQSEGFKGVIEVQIPEKQDIRTDEIIYPPSDGSEHASSQRVVQRKSANALQIHAPRTGDYEVLVRTETRGERGRYVLSVQRDSRDIKQVSLSGESSKNVRTALRPSRKTRGKLSEDDPQMKDRSFYRAYRLPVLAGERWTIEMTSMSFNTHLELRGDNGFTRTNSERSAYDTDSLVTFEAPFSGDLTIYATSSVPLVTGPFTLHAYRGEPEVTDEVEQDGRVIAMLVGLSNYGHEAWTELPYCAADAVRIGGALQTSGMLAPESIILVDERATREAFDDAFERAADIVGPNDVFLFFFSGHGGQMRSSDPTEIDGLDETLVLYDDQIRDDELGDLLLNVDSRLSIVVLDACYSGGFRDTVRRRKNQVGIFSSEEDVSSLVAEQFEAGGYLSNILAEAIGENADSSHQDEMVTVGDLLQYIRSAWIDLGQVGAVDSHDRFAYQELVIERGHTSTQEPVLKRPKTLR